jgi:hypothetical protein
MDIHSTVGSWICGVQYSIGIVCSISSRVVVISGEKIERSRRSRNTLRITCPI